MLLQPLYKAIPISSLNLLAAPMPAPVLAPGAGADTLTVQAASPTCSPAKSMQAHGHPQQQVCSVWNPAADRLRILCAVTHLC